jgi:hypothetical protein
MFKLSSLAALGALASALALTACGGGSSGSKQNDAAAADNALKFSRCMREHGIKDFPDPDTSGGGARLTFRAKVGGSGGPTPQAMEAAQKACQHFRAADRPKLTPQERVAREEQVRKFAKCMREHGIDIETSTAGGGALVRIRAGKAAGGPNPESPAFQAAQKACQSLLPFKGGGGPGANSVKGGGGGPSVGFSAGG